MCTPSFSIIGKNRTTREIEICTPNFSILGKSRTTREIEICIQSFSIIGKYVITVKAFRSSLVFVCTVC